MVLGLAMLIVVVTAAIAPNTGAVPAVSNCQYNTCPSSSPPTPWLLYGTVIGAILVAALAAFLLLTGRLRRRRPPAEPEDEGEAPAGVTRPRAPPPEPYSEEPEAVADDTQPVYSEEPPAETGEPPADTSGGGGNGGSVDDIDSLMNELEKIGRENR